MLIRTRRYDSIDSKVIGRYANRLAVFDGGVPKDCMPQRLVRRKKAPGAIGPAVPGSQVHGVGVTSAVVGVTSAVL
jgi:hypothetical protein